MNPSLKIFFPLFRIDWGKWGYLKSFRAKMACVNSSFRNIFHVSYYLHPQHSCPPTHACLHRKLGMLLWLANDTILQFSHPCFNPRFEELQVSSPLSTLLIFCATCTIQCYHLKLKSIYFAFISHFKCVFNPLVVHFSASEYANTPPVHLDDHLSLNLPTSPSCWFTGLNFKNHHWFYIF